MYIYIYISDYYHAWHLWTYKIYRYRSTNSDSITNMINIGFTMDFQETTMVATKHLHFLYQSLLGCCVWHGWINTANYPTVDDYLPGSTCKLLMHRNGVWLCCLDSTCHGMNSFTGPFVWYQQSDSAQPNLVWPIVCLIWSVSITWAWVKAKFKCCIRCLDRSTKHPGYAWVDPNGPNRHVTLLTNGFLVSCLRDYKICGLSFRLFRYTYVHIISFCAYVVICLYVYSITHTHACMVGFPIFLSLKMYLWPTIYRFCFFSLN